MKKMKGQLSLQFPDEIIEEIFSRVAVEPLMKFRCVSKSLNALICSKRFIKSHLENSRKNRSFPYQSVIITPANTSGTDDGFEAGQCSLQSLSKLKYCDLVDFPTSHVIRVVGSCNGVVCIMRRNREFVMWNPATRAVRKLPLLKLPSPSPYSGWYILSAGMCWDESRDAYKVFALLLDQSAAWNTSNYAGSLYSSDTDSWSTTQIQGQIHGRVISTLGNGQFVSGKFHWLVESVGHCKWSYVIVSFDPESKAFGVIGLPSNATLYNYYKLAVVGGCLCVLDHESESGIGIWLMKEYGAVESWQKVGATELQPSEFVRGKDGEVVMLPSFLVCRNGKIQGPWVDVRVCRDFQMHLHIQSLVSP